MQKEYLYGVIGLLAGALLMVFISGYAVNNNMTGMMRMMGMNTDQMMQNIESMMGHDDTMSMGEMTSRLKDESGDSFDKAFITTMTQHHQGAIDMAQEAKINAKHDEIKKMADDIIAAQTREIEMMKQWQKDWGY